MLANVKLIAAGVALLMTFLGGCGMRGRWDAHRLEQARAQRQADAALVEAHKRASTALRAANERLAQTVTVMAAAAEANNEAIRKRQRDAEALRLRLQEAGTIRENLEALNQMLLDDLAAASAVTCEDRVRALYGFAREVFHAIP